MCGLNSKPFSSGERPCLHPVSLPVPRYCAATPRCPMTRFTAWPRPFLRKRPTKAVPSGTPICVASTVDVVTPRATQHQPGAELAQAVGLDMAAWWQPTADGYFQHVPKAAILEAVGEFAPEHVTRLAKLKKGDIASEAERLADGTDWMPAIFKAETSETMQEQDNAPAAAEAMADELVQTLAA